MNASGTVKGGRVWDGVAVRGQVIGGLAKMGQVFYRRQEEVQQQPVGEIIYLDLRSAQLTRTKPTSQMSFRFGTIGNGWLELFDGWRWSTLVFGRVTEGLNSFGLAPLDPQIDMFELASGWDNMEFDIGNISNPFNGDVVMKLITQVVGSQWGDMLVVENGDIWFEVN